MTWTPFAISNTLSVIFLLSDCFVTHNFLISVPGGLTIREAAVLMEECFFTGCLEGLDIVEVNTELALNDTEASKSVEAAKRIVLSAFGKTRIGNSEALYF